MFFIFFLQFIFDAIRDLLPTKEDTTKVYAIKLGILLVMILVLGGAALTVALNTTWGKRIGIERIQEKQEVLSMTELSLHIRQMFHLLNRVKANDTNVRALYILLLVDKKTGNVVTRDMDIKDTSILVFVWATPSNQVNSIDIMEHGINLAKPDIEPRLRQEQSCIDGDIQQKVLDVFRRSIVDFKSNRFIICPIYARGGKYLTAATLMFYIDNDTKIDSLGNVIVSNSSQTVEIAIRYKDALWESTNLISNYFYDYKIPYIFYYN